MICMPKNLPANDLLMAVHNFKLRSYLPSFREHDDAFNKSTRHNIQHHTHKSRRETFERTDTVVNMYKLGNCVSNGSHSNGGLNWSYIIKKRPNRRRCPDDEKITHKNPESYRCKKLCPELCYLSKAKKHSFLSGVFTEVLANFDDGAKT